MADSRKIIKVFLASPGDLQEERRAAKAVADEFNKLWADDLGYHVELVGWEDTVSGFGRPQALINRDLERCELFIGMMWKRWGTPPDTSGTFTSGFEEEYETSIKSRKATGKPEISLLFKTVAPDQLRDPGPELAKVIAFKEKIISEKMILFEKFDSPPEFEAKVRGVVTTYVQRLRANEAEKLSEGAQSLPPETAGAPDVATPASLPDTPFSAEGSRFLRDFVARSEEDAPAIESVEVARFRLLASLVSKQGNDESTLGVHDANLLFANKEAVDFGDRETSGLVRCGLEYFTPANVPLWHWYVSAQGLEKNLLLYYTIVQSNDRRVGALNAMRLLGQPVSATKEVPRSAFVDVWLADSSPVAVKVAALGYLGDWGLIADLPRIRREFDRASYQTTGAAVDAMIRINLRDSREKAIQTLFELQPDSISEKLLDAVFAQGASLATDTLQPGLDHRSSGVRRFAASLLRQRGALSAETAERLLADGNAKVRFEAIQALASHGRTFSLAEAKAALVKSTSRGALGFGGSDREGESCLAQWQAERFRVMPLQELERMASESSIFDRDALFALAQRDFEKRSVQLRLSVDDQFKAHFKLALDDFEQRYGVTSDTYKQTESLDEFVRNGLTRQALDVICQMNSPEDLNRVRLTLRGGFVSYSDSDVEFLRKHGEWEDIPLIVASVERTSYSLGLLSWQNGTQYIAAAKAIYAMGHARFAELLALPMPKRLLRALMEIASEKSIKGLSDETIAALLQTDDDSVRKMVALKLVRALPKARLKKVLVDYMSGETFRYYNVVHWLDLGVSLPRPLALHAAARAIAMD